MTATSHVLRIIRGGYEIRTLGDLDEVAAAAEVFRTSMVGVPFPEKEDAALFHEPGRGLGAFDGDRVVGVTEAYGSWLTVPGGGRVSHAAVTHVGVLPSHTRRGIVSALLAEQLHDIAGRGEVVASLRASEAVIYERFGYGAASRSASYEISRRRGGLRGTVPPGSPVTLADPDDSEERMRRIYDQVSWVGSIGRYDAWWSGRRLWAAARGGPRYLVVSGAPGEEDGYALYRPANTDDWFTGGDRTIVVDDLVATGPSAYLGLIRHFAELDLTDRFRLGSRPVDEPLGELFTDSRSVQLLGDHDETWLRLIDVEAALQARSFQPGPELVIGVADALLPGNGGNYRIGVNGVRRTEDPAEVSLDAAALAAVYLGSRPVRALALAGRVREHRRGAVADADARFIVTPAAFAGTGF